MILTTLRAIASRGTQCGLPEALGATSSRLVEAPLIGEEFFNREKRSGLFHICFEQNLSFLLFLAL